MSYVKIEVIDSQGNLVPDASIPVKLTVSGAGEIAGSGNACPTDMESFNNKVCKTYRIKVLVIIRPKMVSKSGKIFLKAEANGLDVGEINIAVQ